MEDLFTNDPPDDKAGELDPEDFYKSPEGYIIFTEKYHLKRGYCCKSACKHCPYDYDPKTGSVKGGSH